MSTILIVTSPAKGHLYPIVETAQELRRRGHTIHVSTLDNQTSMLESFGFHTTSLPTSLNDAELDDWNAKTPVGSLAAIVRQLLVRLEPDYNHTMELIDRIRPDVVLGDLTTVGTQAAAERSGLPWGVWSPTFLPLFSTDGPPMGLGLSRKRMPPRDAVLAQGIRSLWNQMAKRDLNRFRTERGLPPLRNADEFLLRPQVLINFTGPPLEHGRRDWPDSVKLVGPSVWAPPAPVHQEIAAIEDPIALVTCSTEFQDDGILAQTALDALEGTGLHAVVTTGALHPAGLRRTDNSTVLQFGPHQQILEKAAVVISHGGMGITHKALSGGVPMVVVPFGRDQHDVAKRVTESGAGTTLKPKDLNGESLLRKVGTALSRNTAARKVGTTLAAESSAGRAADLIESLSNQPVRLGRAV